MVPGWAAGGGHSLHVVCGPDARQPGARPVQADRRGRGQLRRRVRLGVPGAAGRPEVRPGDLLPGRRPTRAEDAHRMGMVNAVVPHAELERTALEWARKINGKSPTAQRMLKFAFNLIDDGLVGSRSSRARRPGWPTAPTRPPRAATPSWRSATPTGRPTPGTDASSARSDACPYGPGDSGHEKMRGQCGAGLLHPDADAVPRRSRGGRVRSSTAPPAGGSSRRSPSTARPSAPAGWRAAQEAAVRGLARAGPRRGSRSTSTVPAVGPGAGARDGPGSGCRTAKVKVAERGQADADDVARVEAVRDALGPAGGSGSTPTAPGTPTTPSR